VRDPADIIEINSDSEADCSQPAPAKRTKNMVHGSMSHQGCNSESSPATVSTYASPSTMSAAQHDMLPAPPSVQALEAELSGSARALLLYPDTMLPPLQPLPSLAGNSPTTSSIAFVTVTSQIPAASSLEPSQLLQPAEPQPSTTPTPTPTPKAEQHNGSILDNDDRVQSSAITSPDKYDSTEERPRVLYSPPPPGSGIHWTP